MKRNKLFSTRRGQTSWAPKGSKGRPESPLEVERKTSNSSLIKLGARRSPEGDRKALWKQHYRIETGNHTSFGSFVKKLVCRGLCGRPLHPFAASLRMKVFCPERKKEISCFYLQGTLKVGRPKESRGRSESPLEATLPNRNRKPYKFRFFCNRTKKECPSALPRGIAPFLHCPFF